MYDNLNGIVKNTDYFHQAIKKYGEDKFEVQVLETGITDGTVLNEREIYWISKYNSTNNKIGYNLLPGGTGGKLPDYIYKEIGEKLRGRKQSLDTISKRVRTFKEHDANKGNKNGVHKLGVKKKISNTLKEHYNNIYGEQLKKKISNTLKEYYKELDANPWNKGLKECYSDKTREKISNSLKKYYDNNPQAKLPSFKGHHHTEQTKQVLRDKHWYNDGINCYFCNEEIALLNNYIKGRINYRRNK